MAHAVFIRTRLLSVVAAGLLASVSGCGDPVAPLPDSGVPDQLEFVTGGFGVGYTTLELHGDTLLHWHMPWTWRPGGEIDTVRAVPSAEQWRTFWAAAERAGVQHWHREYRAEDVLDGAGWSLRLKSADRLIESEGSNAYPGARGREHELEVTDEFKAFRTALSQLIGARR